ncbi:uncharacterized protein LOC142179802 [Nicotiana tabacum]|uniref:Uncharacterized protein LOC142179802 n=1 Tax=Nicotiana tabacum TaxID=4097 RepID=A0AC58UBB9_TOBAC
MAARKLRPYFQCHPISVITAYPLRNILHKQELSGRLAKWAIELSEYNIIYQPRTTIKSQVLADFIADFNTKIIPEVEKELQIFIGAHPGTWTLFTDGSSNVKGASLGIVLIPPSGESIRQAIKCYPITNNEAEYEVGTYTAREARMQQYLEKARELVRKIQSWKIVQIPKEENAETDALANLALVAEVTSEENAILIHLFHSALDQDKHEYGIVPEGKKESQVLQQKAAHYCLIRDNLYRKMFGGPLARCLGPNQTEYVMGEVHEGHCGNHAGGRSLVKTLIRAGYHWPKIEEDAENFVAKCDKCQRYANNMHRPAELLHTVISPWPFMKRRMDIVGPLPRAKGKEHSNRYRKRR